MRNLSYVVATSWIQILLSCALSSWVTHYSALTTEIWCYNSRRKRMYEYYIHFCDESVVLNWNVRWNSPVARIVVCAASNCRNFVCSVWYGLLLARNNKHGPARGRRRPNVGQKNKSNYRRQKAHANIGEIDATCAVQLSNKTSTAPFPRCLKTDVTDISRTNIHPFVQEETLESTEFQRK